MGWALLCVSSPLHTKFRQNLFAEGSNTANIFLPTKDSCYMHGTRTISTHTHTHTHTNCSPTIIPHVLEEMIRPSFPARSIPHDPIHYLYDIIITSLANTYMHSACAHTLSSITSLSTAALKKCMMLSPTHICTMYIHVHVGVCFCCVVCLPPYLHLGSSLISDSRKSRALIYGSPL